jgi:asparagine synthase (glutamine-hydrolysing)
MFAGWASFSRAQTHRDFGPDTEQLLTRLAPFHTPDNVGRIHLERFTAAQSLTFNTPESHDEQLPSICPVTGNVLTSWIRLDNRTELGRGLNLPHDELDRLTDPDLVLAAYRRWGVDCANRLEGDFSIALWDRERQALYLARDSVGIKPLFYAHKNGAVVFATTAACFFDFANVDTTPGSVWLARFVSGTSMSFTETPFQDVFKLAPGHWLLATDAGAPKVQRFHKFIDDAPWADERDPQLVLQYRHHLEESVRARLRSSYPHGAETSGGLDSSAIVGLIPYLDESQRATLQTYGYAFSVDEPQYMLQTSQLHAIRRNTILTNYDHDPTAVVMRGYSTLGYPIEDSNALVHNPFYSLAQDSGIRSLHSGFGGDEVVTNNGLQLTQELLSRRRWHMALNELPGKRIARPARLVKRTMRYMRSGSHYNSMKEWLAQELAHQLLSEDALEAADTKARLARNVDYGLEYESINGFILSSRLSPHVPTRTEQCTVLAASYGVDYRWALLDRRLMQQYLSTPAIEKWGNGYGRYLHRRAIAGIVPPAVAWNPSKDLGAPATPLPTASTRLTKFLQWSDIHPAIQAILNPRQYVRQVAAINQPSALSSPAWDVLASLTSVSTLNSWLSSL